MGGGGGVRQAELFCRRARVCARAVVYFHFYLSCFSKIHMDKLTAFLFSLLVHGSASRMIGMPNFGSCSLHVKIRCFETFS